MDITAAIILAFRTAYPRFTSAASYPDDILIQALCEGDAETGGRGWGSYADDCHNFKQRGMFLYAAHWLLCLYPKGAANAETDGASGSALYAANSKSVGDESIGFDTGDSSKIAAGDEWLKTTQFGQQWLRLRRRAGMGALAV